MIKPIVTNIKELQKPCIEVENGENLEVILQDLRDTLATQKGYGLSANQIGVFKKVALYNFEGNENILINPELISKYGKIVFREGCLSMPGFTILTDRYNEIKFRNNCGLYVALGLEAIIIQHEIDHLNGLTILNRKHKAR